MAGFPWKPQDSLSVTQTDADKTLELKNEGLELLAGMQWGEMDLWPLARSGRKCKPWHRRVFAPLRLLVDYNSLFKFSAAKPSLGLNPNFCLAGSFGNRTGLKYLQEQIFLSQRGAKHSMRH